MIIEKDICVVFKELMVNDRVLEVLQEVNGKLGDYSVHRGGSTCPLGVSKSCLQVVVVLKQVLAVPQEASNGPLGSFDGKPGGSLDPLGTFQDHCEGSRNY